MVIIMKNTVKKNLCTFIAVIVVRFATIVFAGCSDNGAPQASTGSEVASQTSDDIIYHRQNNRKEERNN